MPTTTATVTISSSDLTGDALSLSTTSTLTKAGSTTGLDQTTGVARKTTTSTSAVTIYSAATYTLTDAAHKVYVKNTSTVATEYCTITINTQEVGRLYAGDWMLLPWSAASSADVKVTPSVATSFTFEHMLIYHA